MTTPRLERHLRDLHPQEAERMLAMVRALVVELDLSDPERVPAAVVAHAGESWEGFLAALDLARTDWRDVLVGGGLADEDWREELERRLGR